MVAFTQSYTYLGITFTMSHFSLLGIAYAISSGYAPALLFGADIGNPALHITGQIWREIFCLNDFLQYKEQRIGTP